MAAPLRGSALILAVSAMAACGGYGVTGRQVVLTPALPDSVVLTYLGAGGWLIESGGEALLTGPFFSNPNPVRVLAGEISVDTAMIDRRLGDYRTTLREVRSILIGHGHYDHLMDVPYVVGEFTPDATVFGSNTVRNHMVGWSGIDPGRLQVVDDSAGDDRTPGKWITDQTSRFRFQPVLSEHSPHFAGIHLWMGDRDRPHTAFPVHAADWVEGTTYAYLIDVLDGGGAPFFRIYYQDSGATPPKGHPALATRRDTRVPMVAVISAPGHKWVDSYPDSILEQLEPEYVLVTHWEDFLLRKADQSPKPIPLTFLGEFEEKMRDSDVGSWWLPAPRSRWVFRSP